MSLGVLNNLSAVYAENNLSNSNNSLNTVLQQLSSGSKINSGADDAAGLSLVDGLQANQQALTQSKTNAQEGVGLLQVADGALSQVTSLLNRAVTLATEASNGTLNSSQDTAANQEYQSILSEINNIGTTTTYNDTSVFGQASTNIYTGDSSAAGSSIDSLNIRSLSSSNVGDSSGVMSYTNGASNVFIDLSSTGNNAALTDSFSGGATGTTTVNIGYMTSGANGSAVSATTSISVGAGTNYGNNAQGLISAINNSGLGLNATFATAQQAGSAAVATASASKAGGGSATDTGIMITGTGIGANGATFNGAGVVGSIAQLGGGQVLGGTLSIVGADGNSHTITLGTANSTDTLANLASYVNSQGYGVTAAVNSGTGALQFTTSNSNVSVSSSNLTENTVALAQPTVQMQGATIGTIAVANASDQVSGTLNFTEGIDALGTAGTAMVLATQTLAQIKTTINAATATTGMVATTNASAIGTLGSAGYQAIGTVLTLTAANTGNNTAGTAGAAIVDLGTPTVTTTGLTTAALVNNIATGASANTIAVTGAAAGNLGTLSVAQAGDLVGGTAGQKLSIMNGLATPAAADLALTTGQTLQQIAASINNVGGANSYGDGIVAVLNSTNTSLTFYEGGSATDTASVPTISGAGLTDTSIAGTATFTASGSGAASLGSLTVGSSTDVLSGTLNITKPNGGGAAPALVLNNQTLTQLMNTINTTAAYGITAALSNSNQTLTFTATSTDTGSNPIITNSGTLTDTTPSVATNLTMTDVPTPGAANSTTLGTIAMSGTLTGSIKLGSQTITIGVTNNTGATLAAAINNGKYGVTAAYANGTMTFSSPNSAMSIVTTGGTVLDAGGAPVGALVTTAAATSSAYYSLGISSTGGITDSSTSGGTTNTGITTDSNGSTGTATISYSDGAGSNLSASNLSSQTSAIAALTSLDGAITAVAAQDGYIGAQINTLNAVSSVLSTQQENVQSAQNAVQATDYASATSNMSKYEILSQTGISALAQANSMEQEVTKLLQ